MPKWAKVSKGQAVILKGERYAVTKHKLNKKGTKVDVVLEGRRGRFERTVDADLKVELDPVEVQRARTGRRSSDSEVEGGPLHDENGSQRRWATQGELEQVLPPDPEKLKAPWAKTKGKAEKAITSVLGAKLVGEATDPNVGWYVPAVDIDPSTIDAHLLLFHDVQPEGDYKAKVKLHDKLHADAIAGPFNALHVNHWHTTERPAS